MHTLRSGELTVELLDPNDDRERMGARYCTAGYIFQVHHAERGPLLSGPQYPDAFSWFDGQGIPDTFHRAPLPVAGKAGEVVVPGVGLCTADGQTVLEFAEWERSSWSSGFQWSTEQRAAESVIGLSRTVSLLGRTLRSVTRLENRARGFVPVSWYPHPFFPHPADDELCRFSIPVSFADTDFFSIGADQSIYRVGWPWSGGGITAVDHDARDHFSVLQRHPALGTVSAVFGYVPSYTMIYGNRNCFSFEPYFERTLGPGQSTEWYVDYVF